MTQSSLTTHDAETRLSQHPSMIEALLWVDRDKALEGGKPATSFALKNEKIVLRHFDQV
jgi:hypothetical protein